MKDLRTICVLFLLLLLTADFVYSQAVNATLLGTVTDSSGAVVVGAIVTVTNPQTNFTRSATTNNAGNYSFPALLPGVYNVRAEMQGFQSELRSGVELQVQQVARMDFQFRVGAVNETVEVSGGAPLLATENAQRCCMLCCLLCKFHLELPEGK